LKLPRCPLDTSEALLGKWPRCYVVSLSRFVEAREGWNHRQECEGDDAIPRHQHCLRRAYDLKLHLVDSVSGLEHVAFVDA
jgi:hypothetical protein